MATIRLMLVWLFELVPREIIKSKHLDETRHMASSAMLNAF